MRCHCEERGDEAISLRTKQLPKWLGTLVNTSGWLFVAGTIVFSGSLYALSLSGVRWLGMITPLGGLAFLAGWICLAAAALRTA